MIVICWQEQINTITYKTGDAYVLRVPSVTNYRFYLIKDGNKDNKGTYTCTQEEGGDVIKRTTTVRYTVT